ncbi:MAG: RHS repeat-associated core domain-containing protein [Thermodesulfobacteriota bacterium]|nr:RHS repeat-associated core domain-containing protein [Thermodesulfobacteriota bacterium]
MTKGYTPDGYEFTASYDAENRLASIEYTDSQSTVHKAEYIYSGYGFLTRIKKYENSTPTGDIRLIRSGYLAIQGRDANNQVVREYTWGKNMGGGIGGLLSMTQSGSLYNYLYDGRGNVSALLNDSQQVAASYRYDAFGNLMAKTGTLDQPFMFSTKRYDAGTGLPYYGYRFYNPAIGKWLTRDPLGEAGGINLYGFVLNDPVNFIDPYGLEVAPEPGNAFFTPNTVLHYSHAEVGWTILFADYSKKVTSPEMDIAVSETLAGAGIQFVFLSTEEEWGECPVGDASIVFGLGRYLGISHQPKTGKTSINVGIGFGPPVNVTYPIDTVDVTK